MKNQSDKNKTLTYVKCEYCGYQTIKSCLGRHLMKNHNKTVRDNTLLSLHLEEKDIPQCKYCNNKAFVDFTIHETCNNTDCIAKLHKENKHLGAIKAVKTQKEKGTYHFLKENLSRDSNGKSIMHSSIAQKANKTRINNGTHPFIHENLILDEDGKSFIHRKAAKTKTTTGSHPWLSSNLKKNAEGKSILHEIIAQKAADTTKRNGTSNLKHENLTLDSDGKSISHKKTAATRKQMGNLHGNRHNNENYNPDFIISTFVINGKFDIKACCEYFNMTISPINKFKRDNGIDIPNITNVHHQQTEIFDYIKSIYPGNVLLNDRNIISPLELDIVIPDKHLAIEFDGLNFHSQGINALRVPINTDPKYHFKKSEAAMNAGYQLLHIFENEWIDPIKKSVWKSVIKNKLGLAKKIYARKTLLKEVKATEAKVFMENNHLQGAVNSKYNYGLYYNEELVSIMTFGKCRFTKNNEMELLRFCNKTGYSVVGGASKLLSHFKKEHPTELISYANKRWSNGHLYETLGFTPCGTTPPDYFYFKPEEKELYHRMVFQKSKLARIPNFIFLPEKTETENMLNNGYMKIYDCGNLKYTMR